METRDKAFTLYKKGMGCTEIAKKLGVSLNTVKSWKKRYWDAQKGAPKKRTPPHPKGASSKCTQKSPQDGKPKSGAPLGNVNAVGNHGGAPPGNQNALKHGGWSAVMFGSFSEENQKAIQDCTKDVDAEDLLIQELQLLTAREAFLLQRIQYAIKLDVQGAYAHTKQELVMKILQKEIPGATWLLAVVKCLLAMAPGEGLLIGGYLEAWLFNLVASYMLVKVMSYAKIRRGASTRFVIRSGSYMDDLVLFGRRWADIQSAARKLTKWALTELGLTIKNEWVRVDFLSAAEEHQRRHLTGAAKGCPGLDMAGYVMHRTYTTIRPRIFLRARRQYIRAKADVSRNGYVPVWRSYKLVSYNGYFDWTKSRAISEALKQKKLFTAAKVAIRVTTQRNAIKKVRIAA